LEVSLIYSQIKIKLDAIISTFATSAATNGDTWPHPLIILIIATATVFTLTVSFFIVLALLYHLFNWIEQERASKNEYKTNSDSLVKEER